MMNDYLVYDDIEVILELKGMTQKEFADAVGVSLPAMDKWKRPDTRISPAHMEAIYNYAFSSGISLNRIKEQLYKEDYAGKDYSILFHGAKAGIDGPLSIDKARGNNDFGQGFYCGETFEQAAMFVSNFPGASVYIVGFDTAGLCPKRFHVDQAWMFTIAYFRNRLGKYASHPLIRTLVEEVKEADYVIAPTADNRMFEIIDSFIEGEITDIQCQQCLSATNLGSQYVFTKQNALEHVTLLRHCYLAQSEKDRYLTARKDSTAVGRDKVRVARKQYRGQGKYIEEILQ